MDINSALILEVAFVSNEDDGNRLRIFHTQKLSVHSPNHVEGIPVRDGVYQEKTLALAHIMSSHGAAQGPPGGVRFGARCQVSECRASGARRRKVDQKRWEGGKSCHNQRLARHAVCKFERWASTYLNSSWPAVSKTSTSASSPSMTHCFRYRSKNHKPLADDAVSEQRARPSLQRHFNATFVPSYR